jgi:flagellar FliL protein
MASQPAAPAAEAAAPKKKGKKLILIGGVLVLALGGGGAGAWYFMRPADPHAAKAEPEKPAQFLPLESFTVNLVGQDGAPQYLQAGLTLKLGHDVKVEAIKERMPEIRNRILLVLSAKKANELLPVAGKNKLAIELSDSISEILGDTGKTKNAKKAKVKAEADADDAEAATEEKEASEKDGDTQAETEGKSERKAERKQKAKAASHVAKREVEVLFTSFIIQ